MFTDKAQIRQCIIDHGYEVEHIEYIDKGVMTDKYLVVASGKRYIARCYPQGREWLAETEFLYLRFFLPLGIKVPTPVFYCHKPAILFYEELEGHSLNEVYVTLSDDEKNALCCEVIENYNKICQIEPTGFGRMTGYEKWSHKSWGDFLNETIDKGHEYLIKERRKTACDYVENMKDAVSNMSDFKKALVWSDFCQDNIIVTRDHHLAGFVDIEGLIAGDSQLGIGYLKAHDQTDFPSRIGKAWNHDTSRCDFYSVFRYLGLLPYLDQPLPNNSERAPISEFLSYPHKLLENKSWFQKIKRKYMRNFITIIVLAINILICYLSAYNLQKYYNEALCQSNISVVNKANVMLITGDSPSWFKMTTDSLYACKAISDNDKQHLNSLVSREDSLYQEYAASIDDLSYKSNNNPASFAPLFLLTLIFVSLGCCALTFYDYIGHVCYLKDQDMLQWWPWYLFRPLIGVPLASLLIVAVHTAMFSNVFTSSDLNTYAAVSFLVGFAMMEFLKMLRRLGKSLFGGQ